MTEDNSIVDVHDDVCKCKCKCIDSHQGIMEYFTCRRRDVNGVFQPVFARIWCGVCMCVNLCEARVYVVFVSSTWGIIFNPIAGAITYHSQSVKIQTRILSPSLHTL